jgi:hypothetical protein
MDEAYIKSIRNALSGFNQDSWHKTIDELIEEIKNGDCQLRLFPEPIRTIVVGFCHIIDAEGLVLMESEQTYMGSTVRYRNQPVGGKFRSINRDEEMIRELHEELGVSIENLNRELSKGRLKYVRTEIQSAGYEKKSSYPDLKSEYTYHYYEWAMPEEYIRDKYIEKVDSYRENIFRWVDPAYL